MTIKKTRTTRKPGKRNIKVGKLPRAKKQLSGDEMKAVEGAGPLASFTSGFVKALEDVAAGGAHAVSEIAAGVEKVIKG